MEIYPEDLSGLDIRVEWNLGYMFFYIRTDKEFSLPQMFLIFNIFLRLACSYVLNIFGKNSLTKKEIAFCS